MLGEAISHYKILEHLGQGGMGVVYKAQDLKLDRCVALKFLPPHLSENEEEKKRFIHEAKAASALDHPNLCTIYEIDETNEGRMFIAMAYYEGETLRQKVSSNQLSVTGVIEIAMQITQGLAKAHAHGIVHRDLKPENVIITKEGVAKIVDFGLAKLTGHTRLTKDGATKGTAAYMSPEQARGEDTDHRTDIWSLGVVMYEMLTGQLPFKGEKEPAVIYGILTKDPKPVTEWRHETPIALEQVINRAMAKDAEERYQRAEEILEELKILQQQPEAGHAEKRRTFSRRGIKRTRAYRYAGIAGLLVLLLAFGLYRFLPEREAIDSVAVLPFVNASADPEAEYLSAGISESLIRSLSQLPHLKVMSFSVVSHYKGEAADPQALGRKLNVQAVLVGRVTQQGEALAISVELVDTQDNRHIWGEQYQRQLTGLLGLQNEITEALSEKLQPHLSNAEKQRATKRHTQNFAAHQLYLKGRYHAAKYKKESFEKGFAYFQQALEQDPNYALAYDGLAYYYIAAFEWLLSPREALPQAKAAARKALALDETLAEAHASLGAVYFFYDWDWPAAEREFKRALQLNSNYATTYQYYAQYLVATGRLDEALAIAKRAHEIEPLSPESNTYLGWILNMTGQNELAATQLNSALEIDSSFWFARLMLAGVYEGKGQLAEACAEYEKASALEGEFSEALANLGSCYARHGKIDEARKILLELKQRAAKGYVPPYFFFMIHYALGEKDEALPWFAAAYEQRCIYLLWDKVFSYSDYQRSDPRLAAILDKVGVKSSYE
ncbi:protein kinase [candidate division KSB1 bacterium]|nr:protein kinase [candidate division KSB1 bacterium]